MLRGAPILVILAGLAACDRPTPDSGTPRQVTSRSGPPAAAAGRPAPPSLAPTPTALPTGPVSRAPAPPPQEAPVPVGAPASPLAAPTRTPYLPPPFIPSREEPTLSTPAFTFRTMDHRKAYVLTNGQRYSDTTCLFALTLSTEFDSKIEVPQWPPAGARWIGKLSGRNDQNGQLSTIELAIQGGAFDLAGRASIKSQYPHLGAGEQVLFVKADICGTLRQGAIRLKVIGTDGTIYRYVDYSPLQTMEEEDASKLARSVWFEAEHED